jgi:ectoine hydroxylase-related dioxygenase (phytanoyl-CoA dioxygenase family)
MHSNVPVVNIPDEARRSRICPIGIVAEALSHLHVSGIVILENAVDIAHLEAIDNILGPEAVVLATVSDQHHNFGVVTTLSQAPPVTENLMFDDVWVNPFVLHIMEAILGAHPILHLVNGNTALGVCGATRQPVHADIDFPHPNFPFGFVVNIPLIDMTAANGATEIWLGSHTDMNISMQREYRTSNMRYSQPAIIPELVEERRLHSPPVRALTKKGSIIIRDLRLWHAGMPNFTSQPRVMLSFVWQANWWRGQGKVQLPAAVRDLVTKWEQGNCTEGIKLGVAAEYIDGHVDHLAIRNPAGSLSSSDADILAYFFI